MQWAARYVGIPFVDDGFGTSGCHCWGLVHLVYWRECGIDLPRYDTVSSAQLRAAMAAFNTELALPPWMPVQGARRDFDLVLMSAWREIDGVSRKINSHIGIAVGADRILHVERTIAAVCVPADHHLIRCRIAGSYRHEALAA